MKKSRKIIAVIFSLFLVANLSSCGNALENALSNATLLSAPAAISAVGYEERSTDGYKELLRGADDFSAAFSEAAFSAYEKPENFAVSPVSVFMALSLAAECSASETQRQILSALNVGYPSLSENFAAFFSALCFEQKDGEKLVAKAMPTNSIWVNEGFDAKKTTLDSLSEKYYCYSYAADFKNKTKQANDAIRKFVKDNTNGLIDKNFNLSKYTIFTLINTFYLKDAWDISTDLFFTDKKYEFKEENAVKNVNLLQGHYFSGRKYEGENFTSFYTATSHGYKLKFILPNDGYTVSDVFTAENLKEINSVKDYNAIDDENMIKYTTRCLFPEFKASYDESIKDILSGGMGITDFFNEYACDLSGITNQEAYCEKAVHAVELKVDKTGLEGAAVTVFGMKATSEGPWEEYTVVRENFILDRPFGFIITSPEGVPLFSGVIRTI